MLLGTKGGYCAFSTRLPRFSGTQPHFSLVGPTGYLAGDRLGDPIGWR